MKSARRSRISFVLSIAALATLVVSLQPLGAQTPPPSISINDVSANEGNSGTTAFTFTVTLSNPPPTPRPQDNFSIMVDFATANGTAIAGACPADDYLATSGSLTFNRNNHTRLVTVQVCGDSTVEANELFLVNLSNERGAPVIVVTKRTGVGTILNDDAPVVRPTSTNVTCDPATVPVLGPTTCTATVTDTDAGTSTPQGTVTFTLVPDDGETGAFTPAPTCTLDPAATGDSNSCQVTYTPATIGDGTHAIGASYTPTSAHSPSSDPTPFQLTVRARTTSTNVTCDPATVPVLGPTTCTATVTDTDAGTSTPQGTVTFTLVPDDGETGAFTPAPTCTLDPAATGDSNSCQVTYTPATIGDGTHAIGASYTPTSAHSPSSDPTPFQLTVRARTTSTSVSCPSPVEAGESTTCTATVTDTDAGTSTPQGMVSFSASGSGNSFVPPSCTLDPAATGDSNSCSVSYSSIQAATHTVTATYGGDALHEGSEGMTTVTVEPGPPANVSVAPPTAVNDVDTQHCVTATVRDRFGNPTPDIAVLFSVTGSNIASGSGRTNPAGEAEFCYTGVLIGITDVIRAVADFSPENGAEDPGEPSGTATKVWRIPPSTALCEVTITEGGWIVAQNGDRASFGGNARVSSAGDPSGQQEYQDHGPAQPMNVKSTEILAVLCTDSQATIFGLATIDGAGSFAYRIDLVDGGEPSTDDRYRMRIATYDSGDQPLQGGNVQVHKP